MHETGERNSWIINKTETEERCRQSQNWNIMKETDRQTAGPETDTQTDGDSQEEGLEAVDHPHG